jgi:uncharacterized protein YggT (Ycf19 family)
MGLIRGLINGVLDVVSILLIIRIIMSFLGFSKHSNRFTEITFEITDVILAPIQKIVGPIQVGNVLLDFAPLILLVLINIIQSFI